MPSAARKSSNGALQIGMHMDMRIDMHMDMRIDMCVHKRMSRHAFGARHP